MSSSSSIGTVSITIDAQREVRRNLLKNLAREYQEFNGSNIEAIYNPSALDFLRIVRVGRPVLIEGVRVAALKQWTDDYLVERMGSCPISIAITPNGTADALVEHEDKLFFTEPLVEAMDMNAFLSQLSSPRNSEILYLQSQNGNLYSSVSDQSSEFESLLNDVPRDIPWASEALGLPPDAVNLWIGDERSVTSIHSDPYENIYLVLRGRKHFTLFPPTEAWRMREKFYPHARYIRNDTSRELELQPSLVSNAPVRWSSIRNPRDPNEVGIDAHPIEVTLEAGESLYLPAGWWHYVRQSGLTIALNWWYDMEPRGMGWVWQDFLRGSNDDIPDGNH